MPSGPTPQPDELSEGAAEADGRQGDAKPPPLQLELPGAPRSEGVESTDAKRAPARSSAHLGALGIVLVAIVVLAALAVALTVWLLPWYVRRQCIEAAAAHGVDLSVDEAKIDSEGFHLAGVVATAGMVRGARARAPAVDVQTSGLRPKKVVVHGAELALAGRWSDIDSDLARWRGSPSGGGAGGWAPVSIVIDGARVVWQAPIGESVRVEAADVHAEVDWSDRGTELHARSDQVTAAVPRGTLGSWRVDVERTPGGSRIRVALDPGVPEACTFLMVGDSERTRSVDLVIPRTPLAHLGIPPQFLGLRESPPSSGGAQTTPPSSGGAQTTPPSSGGAQTTPPSPETTSLQIEATLHYATLGPARADASAKGGVYGIGVAGLPNPLGVSWEGTLSGDVSTGVEVKKARLAVGPLVGPLTGTVKRFDDGFRVNLAWAAGPVPCAGFVAQLGLGQPFDVGYELRKLGGSAVKGAVSASVMVSLDSRDLSATKVDFVPEIGCRGLF
jgi:hypothetical protein